MISRRSALVRRLSRAGTDECPPRRLEESLRRLDLNQLEALAVSVDSFGAEDAPCVLLPAGDPLRRARAPPVSPRLFCQMFRWADLSPSCELRQLPVCAANVPTNGKLICCNPYHWSKLFKPDTPPPPYRRYPLEVNEEVDYFPGSEAVSPDSRFSGSSESSRPWCKIAYWELSNRVGRLLSVYQSQINVFSNLPHGDGLCLETLARSRLADNSSVAQTRAKIGHGISVFREDGEVYVYNRTEYPVFVNSPTLDPPNTTKLTVYKILPGYSVKIFDYERARCNLRLQDPALLKEGPFDPNAVRISFAKGWGSPKYSRRFITCCPCWLEVIFLVNR